MASSSKPPLWLTALGNPKVSQTMGKLVQLRPPKPLLGAAIRLFSKVYGADVSEAERAIGDFDSFQDFFTRRLKPNARPIEQAPDLMPSPVDGVLSAFGPLGRGTLIQAKGIEYSLDDLLGGAEDAEPYRNGMYAVAYLAPKNYHRVHTGWQGAIARWRYLPGALFPVNQWGIKYVDGLFARNERVLAHCDSEFGPLAMVMVGATCVGHMRVCFTNMAANEGHPDSGLCTLSPPLHQARGDEFGVFEMGSTVVLLFARSDISPVVTVPSPIVMGQAILRFGK